MNSWITSDHHFGHANIIQYCKRPFKDVYHMNETMIEYWNAVVRPDDVVYYLGDFTLNSRAEQYVERLNGTIHFMPGSHDNWMKKDISRHEGDMWSKHSFLPPLYEIKYNGVYITMCHYAMRTWPRSHHGSLHVYGHSHGMLPGAGRSMDIGVDTNSFYPYRIEDIIKRLT